MTTLISFLGKGDPQKGYRTANYRFDADFARCVTFFGLALTEYLKPDRLILVGTASSMWEIFFDREGVDGEAMLPLIDAVAAGKVDETLLDLPRRQLEKQLGISVDCLLIPYARTTDEQAEILRRLADALKPGERLWLDVTHGFRHLPMLALVAARYLARVVRVEIEEIYYGALEMTPPEGETPVLRLSGLLAMLDWVDALATYDKDGDYGVFAPLLVGDGMHQGRADRLALGAYFERTGNLVRAQKELSSVFPSVEAHQGALGGLFGETLKQRISWFRGPMRDSWELSLADAYLDRRDYLRAATFMYEAFGTRAVNDQSGNPSDFSQRKEAYQAAERGKPKARDLEYLRNALAHGVRSTDAEVEKTLEKENDLRAELKSLRKKLF